MRNHFYRRFMPCPALPRYIASFCLLSHAEILCAAVLIFCCHFPRFDVVELPASAVP